MTDLPSALLLLAVPGLPLLLAIPALRSRISRPCHVALLPAIILLAVPSVVSIDLSWLLFGSGLGANDESRWLLLMSVVIWGAAATLLQLRASHTGGNRRTTFFLLTMAGNLGAIMVTDVVGFFTFSVLMGYAFYALLVDDGDDVARRAGRIYIIFLLVAHLLLFESLLIAAITTSDMGFEAVRHALSRSTFSGLYVSLVIAGFALKAGAWPLHSWLPLSFHSSRPEVALLTGGVPIAMGMLGVVRWLPLGEITMPGTGLFIQSLGLAAILYVIVVVLKRKQLKLLPAYIAILSTGAFTIFLGTGLADPAIWNQYGSFSSLFIISLGFGMVVVVAAIRLLQASRSTSAVSKKQQGSSLWIERRTGTVVRWGKQMGFEILPRLRAVWLARVDSLLQIGAWKNVLDAAEQILQRWTLVITLFLLLGIVIAFLSL